MRAAPPQNDIGCGVPEGQVLALRFLPHLPPDALLELLDKGASATGCVCCALVVRCWQGGEEAGRRQSTRVAAGAGQQRR